MFRYVAVLTYLFHGIQTLVQGLCMSNKDVCSGVMISKPGYQDLSIPKQLFYAQRHLIKNNFG